MTLLTAIRSSTSGSRPASITTVTHAQVFNSVSSRNTRRFSVILNVCTTFTSSRARPIRSGGLRWDGQTGCPANSQKKPSLFVALSTMRLKLSPIDSRLRPGIQAGDFNLIGEPLLAFLDPKPVFPGQSILQGIYRIFTQGHGGHDCDVVLPLLGCSDCYHFIYLLLCPPH